MKSGIKSTEAGSVGLAAALPFAISSLEIVPKEQMWIALVVFGAVAVAHIAGRVVLKFKELCK